MKINMKYYLPGLVGWTMLIILFGFFLRNYVKDGTLFFIIDGIFSLTTWIIILILIFKKSNKMRGRNEER